MIEITLENNRKLFVRLSAITALDKVNGLIWLGGQQLLAYSDEEVERIYQLIEEQEQLVMILFTHSVFAQNACA